MGQVWRVGRFELVGRVGLVGLLFVFACSREAPPARSAPPSAAPVDPQHQGTTMPHGDHSPHHGGMVLMNGDLHYEVVFDRAGAHRVWFTNAMREDLPASLAREMRMVVTRPGEPPESLVLEIDDAGESWVAHGKPVAGDNVIVNVSYSVQGAPHDVDIPFLIPAK